MSSAPRPNVLIIGAARSGTTAVSRFLGAHPDVFVCTPKEPHYLAFPGQTMALTGPGDDEMMNRVSTTDLSAYLRLFAPSADASVVVDGSVSTQYYHETSISSIRQVCDPQTKIISVLRNPVDRAHSAYLYLRSRGHEPLVDFGSALDAEDTRVSAGWHHMWHYRRVGLYEQQLRPFFSEFGPERITVISHDDLLLNPTATMDQLFRFVGLTPVKVDTANEINRSGEPRSNLVHRGMKALRSSEPVRRGVRAVTTARLREKVRSANLDRPALDEKHRVMLAEFYRDDVTKLSQLLGRDFTPWLSSPSLLAPLPPTPDGTV